ncbi:MAG: SHOCT domain-containing protein [Acidobacteriota bacterium]|nr:SHOCT domain-containing protein [Acidobacteriota bacterium]
MNNDDNRHTKPKRITARPSPLSSTITLIMGILFLFFGLALMISTMGEPGEGTGLMTLFMVIWLAACIGIIIYSIINLTSFKESKTSGPALEVFEVEKEVSSEKKAGLTDVASPETPARGKADFGFRLRELENLRKERLITEEEYQRKRREILDEKW